MKRILITMLLSDWNNAAKQCGSEFYSLCLYVTDIDQVVIYAIKNSNDEIICSEQYDRKLTLLGPPLSDQEIHDKISDRILSVIFCWGLSKMFEVKTRIKSLSTI